jgi:hypothetical protein
MWRVASYVVSAWLDLDRLIRLCKIQLQLVFLSSSSLSSCYCYLLDIFGLKYCSIWLSISLSLCECVRTCLFVRIQWWFAKMPVCSAFLFCSRAVRVFGLGQWCFWCEFSSSAVAKSPYGLISFAASFSSLCRIFGRVLESHERC